MKWLYIEETYRTWSIFERISCRNAFVSYALCGYRVCIQLGYHVWPELHKYFWTY